MFEEQSSQSLHLKRTVECAGYRSALSLRNRVAWQQRCHHDKYTHADSKQATSVETRAFTMIACSAMLRRRNQTGLAESKSQVNL